MTAPPSPVRKPEQEIARILGEAIRVNQLKYRPIFWPSRAAPLDADVSDRHSVRCQSAGRPLRQRPKGRRGGKSGLHGHTVPDNVRRDQSPSGAKPRDSATEKRPPRRVAYSRGKGEMVRQERTAPAATQAAR